jgi:glycosyltransferase involved in cell wall biosynthesis
VKPTLRVCVDARSEPGAAGGVVQGVLGLAYGLSKLEDGNEEYRFLVRPGRGEWLQPYLGERMSLLQAIRPATPPPPPSLPARIAARLRRSGDDASGLVPPSKGAAEAYGADVLHLPTQQGFVTRIPTLYHPWDLQHVHYPDFFEPDDLRDRDLVYRTLCRQARIVVAQTRWGAEDLIANLDVPRRKVAVIPAASALAAYAEPTEDDLARVRAAYDLPEAFLLYPAQTWPHKNHLGLVDAVALLAAEGAQMTVVCTGWQNDFSGTIERRVRERGLERRVLFLGLVPAPDVPALYRLARALVFPSLFEGWGFPLLEAFSAGLPVACSDIPVLREIAGPAAATFDPTRPEDVAATLRRMWNDEDLRRELVERGRARGREFSWERTARICRAHYRRVGGARLSDEDRALVHEARA